MAERQVNLTFIAEPTSANFAGKVHGGSVMKWLTGYREPLAGGVRGG